MKKNNHKKAYSLLEVSIAMFIVAILLVSAGTMFSQISQNQNLREKENITLNRVDKIYKAILNYVAENKKLPCPARLDLSFSDANYGNESRTGDECDLINIWNFQGEADTNNLGIGLNMNLIYGMVPVNILNLEGKIAEDGYGNKFSYIIVREFGKKTASNSDINGFEYFAGLERLGDNPDSLDYINIYDRSSGNDKEITDLAIMMIISHGENGKGAYNSDSNVRNSIFAIIDDEKENIYQDDTPTKYNRKFYVDSNQTDSATGELIRFDDLVIFKTKNQLIRDAELEFIRCGMQQGFIESSNTTFLTSDVNIMNNSYYNEDSFLTTTTPPTLTNPVTSDLTAYGCNIVIHSGLKRICGKYGKWSDPFCFEDYKIHRIDEVRGDSTDLKLYNNAGNGIFIENDNNNVGIGTNNPTVTLDVNGTIQASNVTGPSDRRYKKNISNLGNTLSKVVGLKAKKYYWRKDEFLDKNFPIDEQIGLIAQQVEKIFPELVYTNVNGYKSISYSKLTPILIEAIKELNDRVIILENK